LRIYFTIIFILISLCSESQPNRRTLHWYFSDFAGLDFSAGDAVEDPNGMVYSPNWEGSTVMSDQYGNLLFYCDGEKIWNKNHLLMTNDLTYPDIDRGYQGVVAIPKPGSSNLFYVFIVCKSNGSSRLPLYYFTIDISLQGGLGEVVSVDTLYSAYDAAEKITATYHANKTDVWIITRKFQDDTYAAYLITGNGVNPDPILSPAPQRELNWGPTNIGPMKISLDKKYLVTTFMGDQSQEGGEVEVCKFNAQSGEIEHLYSFQMSDYFLTSSSAIYEESSCEFSPCSKFLYVAAEIQTDSSSHVYQFDIQYILDPDSFIQSGLLVDTVMGSNLQLAPDGRIYCFGKASMHFPTNPLNNFLGRFNNPGGLGLSSDYQSDVLIFQEGQVSSGLAYFVNDFLHRFDFEGQCALDTFYFDPWFFPEPTWIQWSFGDPASGSQNISNELHAKHVFSHGGEFEVSVLLTYPSGRVEETSRVVEVDSVPYPNLGLDTLICRGSSLALNANCNGQSFTWSTGQWGVASITVSDTGYYWVRASYANGCDNHDTIHVGFLPETQFDENALSVTPTACGGASGSITGLSIIGIEPMLLEWKDLSGAVLGNSSDLYNLGVGQYYLSVTDGNGCTAESPLYTITDAGNLQVDSVIVSGAICGQNNGVIQVHAVPQPGGQLLYSIDNGVNFYDNGGLFNDLSPGDYVVMIKDLNDCQGVYAFNPVNVADLARPAILSAATLPEIDFLQNGEILLSATGSTADLYYSIDNGSSWQTNNGSFTGLSAGIYDCIVRDENDCDTAFQVEVTRFWATILQAIAGSTDTCTGTTFEIPLLVDNFNDVSKFRMHLAYNNTLMECLGYTGADPSLADSLQVFINEASGDILVTWQDVPAVTLPDQSPVVDIVFTDKGTGQGTIDWYGQAQESYFVKSTADTLEATFITGTVRISAPPSITGLSDMTLCEGEELLTSAMAQGSNPIEEQYWLWPDGSVHSGPGLILFAVEPGQSGAYTFVATDSRGCTSEESILLTVIPTPDPALPNGDTLTIGAGQSLDAGSGFSSYSWNTGETTQAIIPPAEGWYEVTVTSAHNCPGSDSVYIVLRDEPVIEPSQYFYIPNAFTPDGDGRNDVFRPVLADPELAVGSWQLAIFDRWGGLVFETADISLSWDGTKNGEPCPEGAYVYQITFNVEGIPGVEGEQTIVGTVVIVR